MNYSKVAEEYISKNPSIKDSVTLGIVNYSKLARLIGKEYNLDAFEAILIACRRYFDKHSKDDLRQTKILKILKNSKLEIKNKIMVIVLSSSISKDSLFDIQKKAKNENMHIIWGSDTITLITSETYEKSLKKVLGKKVISISKDLIQILIKSPEEIEDTPGVLGTIFSLLSSNDINVVESMSCWTDTLYVIAEKDLTKTMEILKF